MPNFKVEFYGKEDGTFPAEDFILKQPPKMRARIYQYIRCLEIKGNELREPYSKYLRDGIFELRTQQGNDIARVLYFFVVGRKVILTNGFIKKSPKTPNEQIELAKKYRLIMRADRSDIMNKDFRESLNEQLKDPEFKKEYEALEPEFQIIRAMLEARDKLNLTQKDLAELSGITQADISRLENGNANPSIRTLKKLALAMNMTLDIKFVPLVKI